MFLDLKQKGQVHGFIPLLGCYNFDCEWEICVVCEEIEEWFQYETLKQADTEEATVLRLTKDSGYFG